MSFADKIREAVSTATTDANAEEAKPYVQVLEQLAAGLRGPGIEATIAMGADPRIRWLRLHPKHRPGRGHRMLRFFFDVDGVVVSGIEPLKMMSPLALESWLLSFVHQPAFRDALQVLKAEATQEVEARLRRSVDADYSKKDMLVLVKPAVQEEFSVAAPSARLTLNVQRWENARNPEFKQEKSYVQLESAGLILDVRECRKEGNGTIVVEGTKQASALD